MEIVEYGNTYLTKVANTFTVHLIIGGPFMKVYIWELRKFPLLRWQFTYSCH